MIEDPGEEPGMSCSALSQGLHHLALEEKGWFPREPLMTWKLTLVSLH